MAAGEKEELVREWQTHVQYLRHCLGVQAKEEVDQAVARQRDEAAAEMALMQKAMSAARRQAREREQKLLERITRLRGDWRAQQERQQQVLTKFVSEHQQRQARQHKRFQEHKDKHLVQKQLIDHYRDERARADASAASAAAEAKEAKEGAEAAKKKASAAVVTLQSLLEASEEDRLAVREEAARWKELLMQAQQQPQHT